MRLINYFTHVICCSALGLWSEPVAPVTTPKKVHRHFLPRRKSDVSSNKACRLIKPDMAKCFANKKRRFEVEHEASCLVILAVLRERKKKKHKLPGYDRKRCLDFPLTEVYKARHFCCRVSHFHHTISCFSRGVMWNRLSVMMIEPRL